MQAVEVGEPPPGELAAAADVGASPSAPADAVLDDEADRLARVVGNEERLDRESARPRTAAPDSSVSSRAGSRRAQLGAGDRAPGGVDRQPCLAREAVGAAHVVLVLVGEQQGRDRRRIDPDRLMRRSSSRQEKPASTRSRPPSDSTTTALPPLPEPSTTAAQRGSGDLELGGSDCTAGGVYRSAPAVAGRGRTAPPRSCRSGPARGSRCRGCRAPGPPRWMRSDAGRLEVVQEDRHPALELRELDREGLRRQVQREVGDRLQRVVEAGCRARPPRRLAWSGWRSPRAAGSGRCRSTRGAPTPSFSIR